MKDNNIYKFTEKIQRLGCGLDDRSSILGRGNGEIFSSPLLPDQLWCPTSLSYKWVPGALFLG
jgi:hypothetical protein